MMKMHDQNKFEKARNIFRQHGGILRMSEAIHAGIHRKMLYAMLDAGIIEKLYRGLYRLADLPPLGNPDMVSVAMKVPTGVICLISSLSFHEMADFGFEIPSGRSMGVHGMMIPLTVMPMHRIQAGILRPHQHVFLRQEPSGLH